MRQRFSELVDDAFSLFGSGSSSPKSGKAIPQSNIRDLTGEPEKGTLPVSSKDSRRHSAKEGYSSIFFLHVVKLTQNLVLMNLFYLVKTLILSLIIAISRFGKTDGCQDIKPFRINLYWYIFWWRIQAIRH